MRRFILFGVVILGARVLDAQVVLSRRVYAEHGRTFRQLWMAARGSLDFQQLTYSARDHMGPLCSRDGKSIYFLSDRDPARSANAYAGGRDRELWVFERPAGHERRIWQTSDDDGLELTGATADGGILIRAGTGLRCLLRHPWRIEKIDPAGNAASVSPDGRTLAVVIAGSLDREGQSHDSRLFLVDTATGRTRMGIGKYEAPAWSPSGTRIAAVADDSLAILDVQAGKEAARIAWPKADSPPQDLVWSPDEKHLLAGLYGEDGGSGDPQNDYFLLDLAAKRWAPLLTARKVIWLAGTGSLLYLLPVGTTPLAPGSRHSVWTAPLAVFDLATHQSRDLMRSLALNDDLSSCGH